MLEIREVSFDEEQSGWTSSHETADAPRSHLAGSVVVSVPEKPMAAEPSVRELNTFVKASAATWVTGEPRMGRRPGEEGLRRISD